MDTRRGSGFTTSISLTIWLVTRKFLANGLPISLSLDSQLPRSWGKNSKIKNPNHESSEENIICCKRSCSWGLISICVFYLWVMFILLLICWFLLMLTILASCWSCHCNNKMLLSSTKLISTCCCLLSVRVKTTL